MGAAVRATLESVDHATARFLLEELARHRVELDGTLPLLEHLALKSPDLAPLAIDRLTRRKKIDVASTDFYEQVARSTSFDHESRARVVDGLARHDAARLPAIHAADLLLAVAQTRSARFETEVSRHLNDPRADVRDSAILTASVLGIEIPESVAGKKGPTVAEIAFEAVSKGALARKGDRKLGAQGFATQLFVLTTGKVHQGFVTREAGDEVELRDRKGQPAVIAKTDVLERKHVEGSAIPNGLVDGVTLDELAALLAYLESLKAK